ncbi:hypothetical protein LAC81_35720 (plasmid) [Ensifer adhaerens]|uniref:hypothetical protein n=1 Tax=Ensifer adhaerens TaxID=106592 RepID=UPI001CBDE061|nr:hypothetical protein [Ensifer adhaerens]MBZ7927291.1 hypothetical protein [Ensifer adhaerens]UAX98306.1 hypothetical protein LAC78_37020 [Ensifer adhaerens]UAY05689.1 hypothetical protein LAC80_35725 [Ensifer adhaerens]UAY13067.1 hypothetical protein LAC81_35720 [Ensifer adhaerens]
MAKDDNLKAGFTGTPEEPLAGFRKVAQTATDAVKRETSAVATAAAQHPQTASTLAVLIGALAFTIGYVLGSSSVDRKWGYWR